MTRTPCALHAIANAVAAERLPSLRSQLEMQTFCGGATVNIEQQLVDMALSA